ncbi:MAG: hypothetical protein KGL38_10280 [Gemmatimonadota bacterium]|nr:hypothetical protein [Gemmatimonadota bacterium]
MMRRFLALLLAVAGLTAGARSAAAQSAIAPLPSGVTLRVHGPQTMITGVLYQQGLDSVWLRAGGGSRQIRGVAISQITRVEQAHPAYVRSVLLGTGLGALLGAALYPVSAHNDHDVVIGGSVLAGAMFGLLFPRTDWVTVPLH